VPILENGGSMGRMALDQHMTANISELPHNVSQYFDLSHDYSMISLENLICTRARPEGIISANRLMQDAAAGLTPKRRPISVRRYLDHLWLVEDGNSTMINALFSGWPTIPCLETNSEDINKKHEQDS